MKRLDRLKNDIINYIKYNYKEIIFLIIFACFCFYDTNYSIYKPGGIVNVDNRITGDNLNEVNGSFNMAYVGYMKGKAPFYLLAKLIPSWELVKNEELTIENEELEDTLLRDKLLYKEAVNNALYVALNKSNTEYKITKTHNYVYYLDERNDSDLKVGDEIISYDGILFNDLNTFKEYINNKSVSDKINIKYIRNEKEKETTTTIYEENNGKYVGMAFVTLYDLESNYNLEFKSKASESGPSGGLMTSLAIYNKLTKEDITKGKKIVGTGEITKEGIVGGIGGINFKLATAVKKGADIFICPKDNYEEVEKLMKKNKYDIQVISVSTFDDAIEKLR